MRGLFTLLIATIAAFVGGVIGFQLGITSNIGAARGTVVWHAGFAFFGVFFPFLFFFLFIGLLFAAFGGRRRGSGGPGWGGGSGPRRLRLRRRRPRASGSPTPTAASTRRKPAHRRDDAAHGGRAGS